MNFSLVAHGASSCTLFIICKHMCQISSGTSFDGNKHPVSSSYLETVLQMNLCMDKHTNEIVSIS